MNHLEEFDRLWHNLASVPSFNTVVSKQIARELVAHQFVMCHGHLREIKIKSVGAGMWKVFTEES